MAAEMWLKQQMGKATTEVEQEMLTEDRSKQEIHSDEVRRKKKNWS